MGKSKSRDCREIHVHALPLCVTCLLLPRGRNKMRIRKKSVVWFPDGKLVKWYSFLWREIKWVQILLEKPINNIKCETCWLAVVILNYYTNLSTLNLLINTERVLWKCRAFWQSRTDLSCGFWQCSYMKTQRSFRSIDQCYILLRHHWNVLKEALLPGMLWEMKSVQMGKVNTTARI